MGGPSVVKPLSSTTGARRTPLHDVHVAEGARIVEFAGWLLPVQYGGIIDEHLAVRQRAGLFDVSHMGEAVVHGAGALEFLQHVTCNDVARLAPGRAQYTALLTAQGTFIDDLLVYRLAAEEYLLVLNAANTSKDVAWLQERAASFAVQVRDASDDWSQLAIQGPLAQACLQPACSVPLGPVKHYGFVRADVAGASCLVSRTGYTGEDGFEIYAPAGAASAIWRALRAAGVEHGLAPAGLGARDTLRLEARLVLYGQDIDDSTTPLEADLAWIVKLDKGPFVGREALAAERARGVSRKLVGFRIEGRAIARHGHAVLHEGRAVGRVTSGTHSPSLRRSIGLAYVPVDLGQVGQALEIDVRGRPEPAVVVPTPFYRRPS
jgi:aminomethyltransferase